MEKLQGKRLERLKDAYATDVEGGTIFQAPRKKKKLAYES